MFYDPETIGGQARRAESQRYDSLGVGNENLALQIRRYSNLFSAEKVGERTGDFKDDLDPKSVRVLNGFVEADITKIHPILGTNLSAIATSGVNKARVRIRLPLMKLLDLEIPGRKPRAK